MKSFFLKTLTLVFFLSVFAGLYGCGIEDIDRLLENSPDKPRNDNSDQANEYYDKIFQGISRRAQFKQGTTEIKALDSLPKDANGGVNWTIAVIDGFINPKASLDPGYIDEPPLNLNIFIEAKTPLMANVLFPHSIHTYWLSCKNCHPKIFIPEAGANPISMEEIFKGEWCGRCHGKVAFTFWPRENCTRCHMVLKGQSLERERWQ